MVVKQMPTLSLGCPSLGTELQVIAFLGAAGNFTEAVSGMLPRKKKKKGTDSRRKLPVAVAETKTVSSRRPSERDPTM